MALNLLTIVLEWDEKTKSFKEKSRQINPNLERDIEVLEHQLTEEEE